MSRTRIARLQEAVRGLTRMSARSVAAERQWLCCRVPECCWPGDVVAADRSGAPNEKQAGVGAAAVNGRGAATRERLKEAIILPISPRRL
jgi:hypothetical protein